MKRLSVRNISGAEVPKGHVAAILSPSESRLLDAISTMDFGRIELVRITVRDNTPVMMEAERSEQWQAKFTEQVKL